MQLNLQQEPLPEEIIEYYTEQEKDTLETNLVDDSQEEILDSLNNSEIIDDVQEENEEEEDEEESDDDDDDYEDETSLTPEMQNANKIYHQAIALVNGTSTQQYET